jgi:hypothetical protein
MIKSSRIWAGHFARMEEMRKAYRVVVRNSAGNEPLGTSRG